MPINICSNSPDVMTGLISLSATFRDAAGDSSLRYRSDGASEENFFAPLRNAVDNFKLRASFGSLGDDSGSAAYAFLSTFSNVSTAPSVVLGGVGQNGIMTSLVANELLTWERNYSYNVGFDLAMWSGKLGVEFDAFYNYIFDILGSNTGKPASMGGYYPTYINNNAQDVKGIDVKLTHRNHIGKDFQYGVTVNMTWAKDRWLRYQDSPNTPDYAKRTGKSLTLTDLLDEIPVDAARFFFNSRAAETQMEFDLDLAIKQDSDNPLYYVQYAHARICSVLRNAQESGIALPDAEKTDLSVLSGSDERQLIKQIALLPEEIVQSAVSRDPSRLNKYAVALAQQFHHFYNACRIKDAEPAVRDARLTLCLAAKQTIENVLKLIGVDAPESM